jgi:hypothetical protein
MGAGTRTTLHTSEGKNRARASQGTKGPRMPSRSASLLAL